MWDFFIVFDETMIFWIIPKFLLFLHQYPLSRKTYRVVEEISIGQFSFNFSNLFDVFSFQQENN